MSKREVNLNAKNKEGKTAIEIARKNKEKEITRSWASEDECQERTIKWTKIVELLESFERNPNETRTKLRIQLGFAGIFPFYFLF